MENSRIPFDVIPCWQQLGATHGRLEDDPLFVQTISLLNPPRYHASATTYRRHHYHAAMDQLEAAITAREHIAQRSLKGT